SEQKIEELEKRVASTTEQYKEQLKQEAEKAAQLLKETTERLTREKEELNQQLNEKWRSAEQAHVKDQEKFITDISELRRQLQELDTQSREEIRLLREDAQLKAREYDHAVRDLKQEKESVADESAKLIQENIFLQDDNEQLRQQNTTLQDILNSDIELQCHSIVRDKLTPLTKNYLVHLAREIQKSVAPSLDIKVNDVSGLITQVNKIIIWPDDKALQLKQKFDAVSDLYATLQDKTVIRPSEKVTKFYEQLNDADQVIKTHRDPTWKRYTANAAAILGIILTGIFPGLIVLGIMALRGSSPKFWESAGQTFFASSSGEIVKNVPDVVMNKGIK
ncbi:hypothetical protein LOX96_15635, partial [Legionella sp. HCPI-6]|nr:hypothetical protein [Legionella maioricensis]